MTPPSASTELTAPPYREDEPYTAEEFQPQQADSFHEALALFSDLRDRITSQLQALQTADLFTWQGAAADAYRLHVRALRSALTDAETLLTQADLPLTVVQTEVTHLSARAADVAGRCNEAQEALRSYNDNPSDGIRGPARHLVLKAALIAAVADGAQVVTAVRESLEQGAIGLTKLDTAMADIIFPPPPNGGANATIFSPMAALRALEGDTEEARHLLALINMFSGTPLDLHQALLQLSPAEREFVLEHLDLEESKALLDSMTPSELEELIKTADPLLLRQLAAADDTGVLLPDLPEGQHHDWRETEFTENPATDPSVLHQGGLGDCHYLAALAAQEQTNPGFLADHIEPHPENGTYTVTLYDDQGNEVEVTVDGRIPGEEGQSAYAQGTGEVNAYQLYEKAISAAHERGLITLPNADDREGYGTLDGGWASNDLQAITGEPGVQQPPADVTVADIQGSLEQNQPVVVCTQFGEPPDVPPGYEHWYDPDAQSGQTDADGNPNHPYLVPGHEYYVVAATDDTITLANPWGQDDPRNGTVTMTMDEYRALTHTISTGS